jgi:hypothetical protein
MSSNFAAKQTTDLNPKLVNPDLDASKLLGRWLNTNRNTSGITECSIEMQGERCSVSITGAGKDSALQWPRVNTTLLVSLEEEAKQQSVALVADFEFDFMKAETHIRVNKGVLVIVLFITFTDDSGRSNYVNREFFYREA